MKIVEVNDNDIYGKVFNGYDIAKSLNKKNFNIVQLVIHKFSDESFVHSLFKNQYGLDMEYTLHNLEQEILSVHSLISITSDYLEKNKYYQNADLVHYHQFHNTHLNLTKLLEMSKKKPTIISLHDQWFMTGRCVHPGDCQNWQSGCKECPKLDTLFAFSEDNCNELWKIKKEIFENADLDIIVSSEFMLDMVKNNPYTQNLRVHYLPLGIDLKKFDFKITKEEAKKKLGINPDKLVLFFREAEEKGTKYIVEALKKIDSVKSIVLLTCSQQGLIDELQSNYEVIELGNLSEEKMLECYNASDIFLMPSLGESFGMMAIEAMASEIPVVIFDNTALPSTTGAPEIGVLVKNKDANDLCLKIKWLIDNEEERIKRGKLGKEFVKAHYNIEDYEKRLEDIYIKAFNTQKYKLKLSNDQLNYQFDYNDMEVQKTLNKLLKLYQTYLPTETIPELFNNLKPDIKESKIKFSNKNVQNLILNFNKLLYDKVSIKESAIKEQFNIKKTKIYQLLKKSKILRKIVFQFRKLNRVKNLNQKYDNLESKYNFLQKEEQTLINEISSLKLEKQKENIKIEKQIKEINDKLNSQSEKSLTLENEFYKMYKALESKLWALNSELNIILYESYIQSLNKKENFNPKVSVIIPAYNASDYLADAIDSALAQTYQNIEIIVVNDGSTDNGATRKIAESYGNKIKYYEKENGGVSSALNYGIQKMTGQYFAWLSHDDLMDKDHIEKLVDFVSYKENEYKIPYSNFKIIDENGLLKINETIIAQLNCSDYKTSITHNYYSLLKGEINGGSVLIPKEAFTSYGLFDETLRISQERDMWNRLMKKYKFINIPFDTASIRQHSKQVTNQSKKVIEETNQKNLEIIKNLPEDIKLNLESDMYSFYKKLEHFYYLNNNEYMKNEMKKLCEKYQKKE